MKITIINNERNEKRYTREELDEFVAQLKDGKPKTSTHLCCCHWRTCAT